MPRTDALNPVPGRGRCLRFVPNRGQQLPVVTSIPSKKSRKSTDLGSREGVKKNRVKPKKMVFWGQIFWNWAPHNENDRGMNRGRSNGGRNRARTCDPLLVRQVLSQLSYSPFNS